MCLQAARLLGAHVERRPEHGAGARRALRALLVGVAAHLGDAEVEDLHERRVVVVRLREEDVVRLDVAVDDARRVRAAERLAALRQDVDGLVQRDRARRGGRGLQALAVEELHRDVRRAVLERAVVEDLHDVARPELRGRLRLGVEAAERLGRTARSRAR